MHASDTRLFLFLYLLLHLLVRSPADNRVELARLFGRMMEARRFISDRVIVHAALVIFIFVAVPTNRCLLFLSSLLLLKWFFLFVAQW